MALSDGRPVFTATIASSADTSGTVTLGANSVLTVCPPIGTSSFDADSAYLLFKASHDGSNFFFVRDVDGALFYVAIGANNTNGWADVPLGTMTGAKFVNVGVYQSDKATAVTQTAARTIKLVCGRLVRTN